MISSLVKCFKGRSQQYDSTPPIPRSSLRSNVCPHLSPVGFSIMALYACFSRRLYHRTSASCPTWPKTAVCDGVKDLQTSHSHCRRVRAVVVLTLLLATSRYSASLSATARAFRLSF